MTPAHTAYEKMAESLAELDLDEVALRALRRTDWMVTEKIHGANFALVADLRRSPAEPATFRAAKRKSFLEPGEDFFGHAELLARIAPAVRDFFDRVRAAHPGAGQAAIYGELFGGAYPHPRVKPTPGVKPVQTGIHYCPHIEFAAFDATVDVPARGRVYLDQDAALALFRAAGLFCAEPLFVGSYEDAMAFPIGFDSTVPARLGLPPLGAPNPAEGVVVKPVKSIAVPTKKGVLRPAVKRKIARFSEDRRFHEATKWEEAPKGAEPLAQLEWEMLALVTDARLQATISKVGRVGHVNDARGREVRRMFEEEVWSTLAETKADLLASVGPDDLELLRSLLRDEAVRMLKAFLR